jgi:uncharacterized protein (DUF885 family)
MQRRSFCLAAAAAGSHALLGQAAPSGIDEFFRTFTDEWVRNNPALATSQRYFTGAEQDRLERMLAPVTLEESRKTIALARKGLAGLRAFDRAAMSEQQRLWADVMEWQLNILVEEEPFLDYSFPLQQMNGWNVSVVERFTVGRPLTRARDAENYVAALSQVKARTEEAIAESRRIAGRGILLPRFILNATIRQMENFVDPAPANNPFVTAFADKMGSIAELPAAKREQLRRDAEKIVASQIYPAWRKAIATLRSQLPKATDEAGLWRLKGGDEAYAYFLKRFTTTTLSAEEIHQIGLRQVAAIETQMDALLRQIGRHEGSVNQRIERLRLELQYPNPTSEAAREQIMKDLNAILQDAARRSEALFDLRPKSPVIAQPFPTFREANAAANYNAPAADGSRPGIVQYPRRIERMTKFGLRTLAYHEGIPGHHYQIALQVEDASLPRFMQLRVFGGISANSEGWALYAERLAAESGWYNGDIEGQLGQLSDELWRARRLVVDTGLHAKRWTRQQSIDYGIEASEVERYVVYPGQACSYMIGQRKILELRAKAQAALGPKFSLREFHNVVLRAGPVPMHLLERQVDAYIARTAA